MAQLTNTVSPQSVIEKMIDAALAAADPFALVNDRLVQMRFDAGRIWVVAVGKAAVPMARAADERLGEQVHGGIVLSKFPAEHPEVAKLPEQMTHFQGSHPIPDERSMVATQAIQALLAETVADDVVLCLISGGASALLTDPVLPLGQWRELNDALLRSGCTINEINHIRQHFDRVKGGGLLQWALPASCTTLILSDVIGNNVAHIGSGPTVPVQHDVGKARAILAQYGVGRFVSAETLNAIEAHLSFLETQPLIRYPDAGSIEVIGDVRFSAEAAAQAARELGYAAAVVSTEMQGEAKDVGRRLVLESGEMVAGSVRVYGGETTVTFEVGGVHEGHEGREGKEEWGIGGRNQELVLAAAIALDGNEDVWLATLATVGEDGPNDGAGAIVSGESVGMGKEKGLDSAEYLQRHDSYTFFDKLGRGHLRIGSTGTNVNDITIVLKSA